MAFLHERGLASAHVNDFAERHGYVDTFPTPLPDDAYCDNWVAGNGVRLLRELPRDDPWHLVVNFTGPHNPMDITRSMHDARPDVRYPAPVHSHQYDPDHHNEIRRNYGAMIENIDRLVGQFIDLVGERDELDDTLIVYASDHGEMLGDHDRWGKSTWQQPSIGVPLVVAGPGVREGVVSDALVEIEDLAATFLECGDAPALPEADARSLWPVLNGEETTHRDVVVSGLDDFWVIWDGKMKLVRQVEHIDRLFDLEVDPQELHSVAQVHRDKARQLRRLLDEMLGIEDYDGPSSTAADGPRQSAAEVVETDAVIWDFPADEPITPSVRNISSNLQLFFDEWLIDRMEGPQLRLHCPQPRDTCLDLDRPWEGPASGVGLQVLKDGDLYRMYYVGFTEEGNRRTCYAESDDGIEWRRPDLGIIEFRGSAENNILMEAETGWNLCAFIDGHPEPRYPQRYKGITRTAGRIDGRAALRGFTSDDAVHWQRLDKDPLIMAPPDYKPAFDSPISAFWDELRGHYVAYFRGFVPPGLRAIRRSISTDFRNWSVPEFIDLGDSPTEQLYMSACTPYFRAPHVYLMFPNRFVRERTAHDGAVRGGIAETCFMASRDGVHVSRTFMEAFIRPGPDADNWHKHAMMVGTGVHPSGPAELSLYYVENHGHPSVRLRRGSLRTDGFASVSSGYGGGEFVTRPLTFSGDELVINFATSVVGTLRIEIQDRNGRPVKGYGLDACDPIYGDEVERTVRWAGVSDVSALELQPVRLRFAMGKEVDLYSIRFRGRASAGPPP